MRAGGAFSNRQQHLYRGAARDGKPKPMIDQIYNTRILELAADIPRIGRLKQPDASATAHSKLCGSTITVDVTLRDGRVADYAHDLKACALGQASSSIMASHVVGSKADELRELRESVRKMLKENGPPPGDGKWADIAVLEPVRDYKARHASTLLTFDAVADAISTRWPSLAEAVNQRAGDYVRALNALDVMPEGGSLLTLSYLGAERWVPHYNVMGVAKAALESAVRFLAKSFSADTAVRFNAVGAGPLKTSASAGIPGYVESYLYAEQLAFRKRNLETQEVANTAAFLLSPRSSGINGATLVVDAGLGSNYFDRDLIRRAMRPDAPGAKE